MSLGLKSGISFRSLRPERLFKIDIRPGMGSGFPRGNSPVTDWSGVCCEKDGRVGVEIAGGPDKHAPYLQKLLLRILNFVQPSCPVKVLCCI
jgi:hypothetical protein